MLSRLRVAILTSKRPHGVRELLARDPNRGQRYEVVVAGSTDADTDVTPWLENGVPFFTLPLRRFLDRRGARLRDARAREAYDEELLRRLEPYQVDLVLLAGYLYVLTPAFLERYPDHVVNVHHADLLRVDAAGRPLFPGLRAVRDAILAGETSTRATAHVVTAAVDEGPLLARSWPYPVAAVAAWARAAGGHDALKAYVHAHQEWMLATAWPPLLAHVLDRYASGDVGPAWPSPAELQPGDGLGVPRAAA